MSSDGEICSGYESFGKCIKPFGPCNERATQRAATVLIIFPGKLRRKTSKLTNHKSSFLALPTTLTSFECLFFIISSLGNKLKLRVYFLQHCETRREILPKGWSCFPSRYLPTTTWKGKINLKALHCATDLPYDIIYNCIFILNSLEYDPSHPQK